MINHGLCYLCEAENDQYIDVFASEIIDLMDQTESNVIAIFNDIYIMCKPEMAVQDIIDRYHFLQGII
jgi:hypothetical protein